VEPHAVAAVATVVVMINLEVQDTVQEVMEQAVVTITQVVTEDMGVDMEVMIMVVLVVTVAMVLHLQEELPAEDVDVVQVDIHLTKSHFVLIRFDNLWKPYFNLMEKENFRLN